MLDSVNHVRQIELKQSGNQILHTVFINLQPLLGLNRGGIYIVGLVSPPKTPVIHGWYANVTSDSRLSKCLKRFLEFV